MLSHDDHEQIHLEGLTDLDLSDHDIDGDDPSFSLVSLQFQ